MDAKADASGPGSSGGPSGDVGHLLMLVGPLLARLESETLADTEPRVSYRQYRLLQRIDDGCRSPSELARRSTLTMPTISESVESLVRREMLVRERDPNDGRAVQLRLTRLGRDALAAADQATRAVGARIVDELSAAERDSLAGALESVRGAAIAQFRRSQQEVRPAAPESPRTEA